MGRTYVGVALGQLVLGTAMRESVARELDWRQWSVL
jgi:hypothetical protein